MARIRTIKPEFFSHEDMASKSPHARLLALGLLTLADREGRLRWVPMQVHSQVFPWEASVKIEVLLGELIEVGYVVHYEVDGKRYVHIVNFNKHQRLSGKEATYKSRLPAPPEKTNDLPDEIGEALGKQPGDSLGSSGEPLGTGEQGNNRNRRNIDVSKPDGVADQDWIDWLAVRKRKKHGPPTTAVMRRVEKQSKEAGITLAEAIAAAAENEWAGFQATWYRERVPEKVGRLPTPEERAVWRP